MESILTMINNNAILKIGDHERKGGDTMAQKQGKIRPWECFMCNREFPREDSVEVKRHKEMHGEAIVRAVLGPQKCDFCDHVCKNVKALAQHYLAEHEKKIGKRFATQLRRELPEM